MTMTIDEMRAEVHATHAQIRELHQFAMWHGYDYTGPREYVPGKSRSVFDPTLGRTDRWVEPSGPSVADMIAFRWESIKWLVREINIRLGRYTSH